MFAIPLNVLIKVAELSIKFPERKNNFDKSWRGRGSQNILSKIEAPNQGTLCLSVCTLDPQKVIKDNRECKFKA